MKAIEWERRGRLAALAEPARAGLLLDALAGGLLDAPGRRGEVPASPPTAGSGRGPVVRLVLPGGGAAIVRRARRGGWAGRFLPDRFRTPDRAVREFETTWRAREAGLPVPEPLGVLVRRHVALNDVWFATRELDGAEPLSRTALRAASTGPAGVREFLAGHLPRVAAMLRACHDLGLVHADLNLGNVLTGPGDSSGGPFLIDLDGARWTEGGAPVTERFSNLSRLARSIEKVLGREGRDQLSPLMEAYAAGDGRLRAELERRVPEHEASMTRHRAGWRLSGRS